MRTFFILFCSAVFSLSPKSSFSQEKVLIEKDMEISVNQLFKIIKKQTNYAFIYPKKIFKNTPKLSLKKGEVLVQDLLNKSLISSKLSFEVSSDNVITIKELAKENSNSSNAIQTREVKGIIKTTNGMPLPGVNVLQKGTSNGTVTDFDGNYSLKIVSGSDVLIFTYVGYKSKEIPIGTNTSINVMLEEATEGLDEVVIIGYGSERRGDLTGAVGSVKAEELEDNVFNSFTETLQGRVAGVQVSQDSGEPGGGISITIRGTNTLTGNNDPLYILDGIPLALDAQAEDADFFTNTNPLASLNPNDIESIEILKDASAKAIYGSRASNGVVLITTKSARSGKAKVEVSIRTSLNRIGEPYELLNARQYAQVRNDIVQLNRPELTLEELLDQNLLPYGGVDDNGNGRPLPNQLGEGSNFIDALYRTSYSKNLQLAFSGGNEKYSQRISFNFDNQEGVIIDSRLNRLNLRYNSKIQLSKRFRLNTNATVNYLKNERVQTSARTGLSGVTFMALRINPLIPLEDPNTGELTDTDLDGNIITNPIIDAKNIDNIVENKDFILGAHGIYDISKAFTFNTRFGLNYRIGDNSVFGNRRTSFGRQFNGRALLSDVNRTSLTMEMFLNYKKKINNFNLSGVVGVGYEDITTSNKRIQYSNFTFDDLGIDAIQLASEPSNWASRKTNFTLQSAFFRANFGYKNKYLLTVNGRLDGTSKFINGKPWGFFPSGALSWVAHKENFIENLNVFSQLKFRLSYGITGSQFGVGPLATQGIFAIDKIPLSDDNQYTATFPAGISNNNLTWETSTSQNLGVDLGFFKNKLRASVDVYKRNTKDLLTRLQIPSQTGFNVAPVNAGELESSGIELELTYNAINTSKFNWRTSLNWTTNKTELIDLGLNDFIDGNALGANFFQIPGSRTFPGQELGLFYGYNVIGLIQPDDLVDYTNGNFNIRTVDGTDDDGNPIQVPLYPTTGNGAGNNRPGMWIFEDINEDGVINIEDRQVLGNPNPDFFFGWNNSFTIGKFDINMFVQGSFGNDILNLNKAFTGVGWNGANSTQEWYAKRWTLDNQHNDVNWPSGQGPNVVTLPTSVYIEDGSYVRLKNLSIRYNFTDIKGISNASVFVTGTNLITITNYSGLDPEVNTNGANALNRGVDYAAYPRPKVYSIGLNINF